MKTIFIEPDGSVSFLGDTCPIDLPLGKSVRQRVSRIVPLCLWKRLAFFAIRRVCGENGRAAAFTRTWRCQWRATILSTGQTYTATTRAECIRWEIETLTQ
jgi:hypothetical protein